ncbi:serine threonine kinase [Fusarium globosum]|uniref:Serine threonine kinase n=1 Tax=Fusarium globosum TaxID=78864 RepID=A0A8H5YZ93_9HYPO|nr:serine threonine kinase [Fusarium globosum]
MASPSEKQFETYSSIKDIPFHSNGGVVNGVVDFGTLGNDSQLFARKTLDLRDKPESQVVAAKKVFDQELRNLRQAKHYHVTEVVMAYVLEDGVNNHLAFVMEKAEPLASIVGNYAFSTASKIDEKWFACLARVVAHIHQNSIRHRDIKPDNILYQEDRILLADFGLSRAGIGKTLSTTDVGMARSRTIRYCSPEIENGSSRGRAGDIFSLGAVFLEMCIARYHYNTEVKLPKFDTYAEGLAEVHDWISHRLKSSNEKEVAILELCSRMLEKEHDQRPEAFQVVEKLKTIGLVCQCIGEPDDKESKFLRACGKGDVSAVKQLLDEDQCLANTSGAIHRASTQGHSEVVEAILRCDSETVNVPDDARQTALHGAASYGHEAMAKKLLQYGASPTYPDEHGQTPFHYAAGHGHLSIAELLFEKDGTVLPMEDEDGQAPLHCAAKRGHEELVGWLLRKGPKVNHADKKGRVALHVASGFGSDAVVEMLLGAGANVNIVDSKGWTALHFVASGEENLNSRKKLAERLIQSGIDVVAVASGDKKDRCTASQLARDTDLRAILVVAESAATKSSKALAAEILPIRKYSESELECISKLLKDWKPRWLQVSRIYVVLSLIQIPDSDIGVAIDKCLHARISDAQLPLKKSTCSEILAPGHCSKFEKEQWRVLNETLQWGTHCNIDTDRWKASVDVEKELGKGVARTVYCVRRWNTDDRYALKIITRHENGDEGNTNTELSILRKMNHKNIVEFISSFTSPTSFGVFTRPVAECNLAVYLSDNSVGETKSKALASFLGCLTSAIYYLHYHAYIKHGDIKPENILVHQDRVILTDFGISTDWSRTLRTTEYGPTPATMLYCAPEVERKAFNDSSSDIWSLGCVFLEIVTVIKGKQVAGIRDYTYRRKETHSEWLNDLRNSPTKTDDVGDLPLSWISDMIDIRSESRPFAGTLLKRMQQGKLHKQLFGECCLHSAQEVMADKSPAKPLFSFLEGSSIGISSWRGEAHVFFQDSEGNIRQSTRRDYDADWSQRYLNNDVIGKGKLHTPIATTAWKQTEGLGQPTIRVYVIDDDNHVRERIWVPLGEWSDGNLNAKQVRTMPSSNLAVTSWGDGQVFLFYQAEDGTIKSLYQQAPENPWKFGPTVEGAASNSPLAVINFPMWDKHGIRFYFQQEDGMVLEAMWDNVADDFQRLSSQSHCDQGAVRIPATKGGQIAAVTWGSAGGIGLLEMRIYTSKDGGYYESPYSGYWNRTWRTVGNEAADKHIAMSREENETRIYFIENQRLRTTSC